MAKAIDHLGKIYPSTKAMCKNYGINVYAYQERRKRGYTLEEALTIKVKKRKRKKVTDHLGNTYLSITAMCDVYGISPRTYYDRRKKGHTLEEALTIKKVTDHLGNIYSSERAMCREYGVKAVTYWSRRKKGYSLEKALEKQAASPVVVAVNKKSQDVNRERINLTTKKETS